MSEKPDLKVIPGLESNDPFDPANVSLAAGDVIAGKRVILKVPVRRPDKAEFFRCHPDGALNISTALLPYDKEFHLVMPNMRPQVVEALPFELRFCANRLGAVFWWPIRLPGEDGKSNHWWDSARLVANYAKENWVRCYSDRASNMYQPVVATIELPAPAWPDLSVAELLRLGFASQVIDNPDVHVLRILRGEV